MLYKVYIKRRVMFFFKTMKFKYSLAGAAERLLRWQKLQVRASPVGAKPALWALGLNGRTLVVRIG